MVKKTDMKTLYPLIEESIKNGSDVKLRITGYSMYPLVSNCRDCVVLTKPGNIKKGDVPFFKRADGSYILHRVIAIKDGAFKIRGDYELKVEYPVYPEQVVAVAKGFYRNGRYISCDSILYKVYKFFWMNSAFIRPQLLKFLNLITSKKWKCVES